MKKFLRENPTLVFGLGLPLLLVVVFAAAAKISTLDIAPPQYSVIYSTGSYNEQMGLQIHIVNKKATVDYVGNDISWNTKRLYLYSPVKNSLHEIQVTLPATIKNLRVYGKNGDGDQRMVTHLDIPELAGLTIDSAKESPDGYTLSTDNYSPGGGLLNELFIGSRYRNSLVLRKGNNAVRIPDHQNYYNSPQVIGWVIPQ